MCKNLRFKYRDPLNPADTAEQTYGCRADPNICWYCEMENVCAFVRDDHICKQPSKKWAKQFEKMSNQANNNIQITNTPIVNTLNEAEKSVLTILKQAPDSTRKEIADRIAKTVRTVQRILDSLREKGYIKRVSTTQGTYWEVLICE